MLFRRSSSKPAKKNASGEFALFKPLFAVAIGAILFEMLPIDFQHYLAPALVSYDDVFYAAQHTGDYSMTQDDLMNDRLLVRQDETVMTISIN